MWGGGVHAWLLDTQLYPSVPSAMYVSTLTGHALAGFMTDASRERPAKESSDFLRGAAWQRKDLSSWVEGGEEEEESSDEVGDISATEKGSAGFGGGRRKEVWVLLGGCRKKSESSGRTDGQSPTDRVRIRMLPLFSSAYDNRPALRAQKADDLFGVARRTRCSVGKREWWVPCLAVHLDHHSRQGRGEIITRAVHRDD
jgi:hypothetical protein